MAKADSLEEPKIRTEDTGAADLLIAIAAPVDAAELRAKAAEIPANLSLPAPDGSDPAVATRNVRVVVAYPGSSGAPEAASPAATNPAPAEESGPLRFLPYDLASTPAVIPWLGLSATYQSLFGMARELGVKACVVVAPDLTGLTSGLVNSLLAPVFAGRCDLVMPVYPMGKFEGLLNSSILAPLSRVLYGRRVLFPLAQDFGISARLLPELEQPSQRVSSQGNTLFWPATEAALRNREICQVHFDVRHAASAEGVDLSAILVQTVGPLFAEMEANAPLWQHARPSQSVPVTGAVPAPQPAAPAVDVRSMLETFELGARNLNEMWGLVLPPVTLLELKRLARMPAETFRMPDELWVRIIYDFALAYRLRTLSRVHLMGALTPLYLGWVASHVLEVSEMQTHEVGYRVERLARAYEEGKPYLLSRWRWPDRFTP